jgi:hypothetical protein
VVVRVSRFVFDRADALAEYLGLELERKDEL